MPVLINLQKLVPVVSDSDAANTLSVDISIGCTVEGFVAATRQFVNIDDITKVVIIFHYTSAPLTVLANDVTTNYIMLLTEE